jgi:hypothetical protein
MNGIQEFYAFVHEITDMNGNRKSLGIDGFLKSWGLTAEAERDTCLSIIKVLRHVLTVAKERFAKKLNEETEAEHVKRVKDARFLGEKTDVNNIGLMWYSHFGADGAAAAQKWARLMGEQKEKELEEHYSTEELDSMAPRERAVLFWYVTTNCTMHNFHLGGKYAAKAARAITTERTKPAVEALREAGYKSDSFNLCPLLAQMVHTVYKFCSCSVGYVFGKATGLLLMMHKEVYANHPYFRFGRNCGNRFAYQYFAVVPILYQYDAICDFLNTQVLKDNNMQQIVRNLFGQMHCKEMLVEARCLEGLFNCILEPLMVVLGVDEYCGGELEEGGDSGLVVGEEDGRSIPIGQQEKDNASIEAHNSGAGGGEGGDSDSGVGEADSAAEGEEVRDPALDPLFKQLVEWWFDPAGTTTKQDLGTYKTATEFIERRSARRCLVQEIWRTSNLRRQYSRRHHSKAPGYAKQPTSCSVCW